MSIFNKVQTLIDSKRRTAAADWSATVDDIANGKEPTPAKLAELLERNGKTLAELETAVKAKIARREKREDGSGPDAPQAVGRTRQAGQCRA